MPRVPIIMPQLGESIAEATIVRIAFQIGDSVESDQDILEVETNKATMGVTSPCHGRIAEWLIEPQQSYLVGATLGWLEVSEEEARRLGLDQAPPATAEGSPKPLGTKSDSKDSPGVTPTIRGLPVPVQGTGAGYLSPRMKARMNELGLRASDLSGIAGSGAAGRVTIDDLESFLSRLDEQHQSPASTMRVAVADAMRRSWLRPLATVGMPVRLEAMLAHRKSSDPKPGPALYALRALGVALGENSAPGGRLIGKKIVHPRSIDIGFAVETEDGVLVPVLREVDKTPLRDIVARYNDLVNLARNRRLPANAQGGSVGTVTNYGTFGLEWATPIPLPEQSLVLGVGAGRVVPEWNKETKQFVPVTEGQFTLSFDHRVLDGGAAGRLLQRISALLQKPETL